MPITAAALVASVAAWAFAVGISATVPYTTFRPGRLWLDTQGNVIRAHSGGLLSDPNSNRTFWYGSEGYPGGDALLNTKINVYSSPNFDLMNWRREGLAFVMPQQKSLGLPCAAPSPNPKQPISCYADRCKVLFNHATRAYVMWCKSKPFATVAVADNPIGPFKLVHQFNPGGHEVGDCSAYQDPTDSHRAYFILSVHPGLPGHPGGYGFSHGDERQLKIFELTPDFQNLTGVYRNATQQWPLPNKYDGKLEAPAAFYDASTKQNYIWASHCTYWFPNDAVLLGSSGAVLPAGGEIFKRLGNPTHNDTSWQSQSTYVLPVPPVIGSTNTDSNKNSTDSTNARVGNSSDIFNSDVYTAAGAPWIYIADRFMCNFDAGALPGCPNYIELNETGRYVWLPIERAPAGSKTPLVVKWHEEWKLN